MPTLGNATAATGVIAAVLLTGVVVLGISVNRHGRLPLLPSFAGLRLHRYLSLLTVGFIAAHILTAVTVPFARIGLAAAIIPSGSLWIGLGAVAFDLLLALVATSLLRAHIGRRWWRAVHWLAYACWPAAMAHSIGTGPGMQSGNLFDLAVACIAVVVAAGCWRLAGTLMALGTATRHEQQGDDVLPQDRWEPGNAGQVSVPSGVASGPSASRPAAKTGSSPEHGSAAAGRSHA